MLYFDEKKFTIDEVIFVIASNTHTMFNYYDVSLMIKARNYIN